MSQEVCMVNQTILTSGKQTGLQIYLLVKQSKYLGIQGRNNSFSENYVVLKPARVLFFFFRPLIPSLLAPVYTMGWTNNFCVV